MSSFRRSVASHGIHDVFIQSGCLGRLLVFVLTRGCHGKRQVQSQRNRFLDLHCCPTREPCGPTRSRARSLPSIRARNGLPLRGLVRVIKSPCLPEVSATASSST